MPTLSESGEVRHLNKPLYFYRLHEKSTSQSFKNDLYEESLIAARRALIRRGMDSAYCIDLSADGSLVLQSKGVDNHNKLEDKSGGNNNPLESDVFYISPIEMH